MAVKQGKMTGAERVYPDLKGVDAAAVDLTDGTQVIRAVR